MCKAACQNKCQPGAHFKDCAIKRTTQHAPAVKIPVGLRGQYTIHDSGEPMLDGVRVTEFTPPELPQPRDPIWPQIQQAHEASRRQSAMHEACAIASALAAESRKDDDPEPLAALMRHVGTQEHAALQLLKLVGRIGLRQWFDGDFVVLSKEDAIGIHHLCQDEVAERILSAAIDKASKQ